MFVKLTRLDNTPIWFNAALIVTVEPRKGGGATVVPMGDGLDYDVKETPDMVLGLLGSQPMPPVQTLVPAKAPSSLAPLLVQPKAEEPAPAEKPEPQPRAEPQGEKPSEQGEKPSGEQPQGEKKPRRRRRRKSGGAHQGQQGQNQQGQSAQGGGQSTPPSAPEVPTPAPQPAPEPQSAPAPQPTPEPPPTTSQE